ncbi:MAG: RNA-binding protein [Gammaproteobacteria bacterium]|nr:RNA-binding protein [Gammaproteobacteria bacterium]
MIIFIRGIPENVTQKDLCDFVTAGLQHVWGMPLFNKGKVDKCDILRIKNLDTDQIEYHGLAFVENDETANALIKHIDGALLSGKEVEVRNYCLRSPERDHRVHHPLTQSLAIIDRRRRDRRRPNLLVETLYRTQPASLMAG